MVRPPKVISGWAFWMVLAYILLGLYIVIPGGLLESRRADNRLVNETVERTRLNTIRGQRACEARKLIVAELARLAQDSKLAEQVNALNARYPEITPCIVK